MGDCYTKLHFNSILLGLRFLNDLNGKELNYVDITVLATLIVTRDNHQFSAQKYAEGEDQ